MRCPSINSQKVEGNPEFGTEGLTKRPVAVRFLTADTVVDMGSLEVECEIIPSQKIKESDRIWTAGEGGQNPLTDQLREGGQEVFRKSREGHASSYKLSAISGKQSASGEKRSGAWYRM
jgi:hypothetical protein